MLYKRKIRETICTRDGIEELLHSVTFVFDDTFEVRIRHDGYVQIEENNSTRPYSFGSFYRLETFYLKEILDSVKKAKEQWEIDFKGKKGDNVFGSSFQKKEIWSYGEDGKELEEVQYESPGCRVRLRAQFIWIQVLTKDGWHALETKNIDELIELLEGVIEEAKREFGSDWPG